jgi:hypothetical protein
MLKMSVRPLAIKNSKRPYKTPFSVEMMMSSATVPCHPGFTRRKNVRPDGPAGRFVAAA